MTLIELEAKLSFLEPSKSSSTSKEGGGGEEEDLGPVVVITMIKTSTERPKKDTEEEVLYSFPELDDLLEDVQLDGEKIH